MDGKNEEEEVYYSNGIRRNTDIKAKDNIFNLVFVRLTFYIRMKFDMSHTYTYITFRNRIKQSKNKKKLSYIASENVEHIILY